MLVYQRVCGLHPSQKKHVQISFSSGIDSKENRIQLGLYADCAFCCSLLKSFAACQLISGVGM